MTGPRFDDVDANAPSACASFLDLVHRQADAGQAKRAGYDMLDPRPGEHILDIGCGLGDDAVALARRVVPGGRVLGVDLSQHFIAQARERAAPLGLPVAFEAADMGALPFRDGHFDAARIDRVLHILRSPLRAMREAVRVVRDGGRILVSEPAWSTLAIEGGDEALNRLVLAGAELPAADQDIGRMLPQIFARVGLSAVTRRDATVRIRDLATASTLFSLVDRGERAARSGQVSAAEVQAWLGALDRASRDGVLCVSLSGSMLCGHRRAPSDRAAARP